MSRNRSRSSRRTLVLRIVLLLSSCSKTLPFVSFDIGSDIIYYPGGWIFHFKADVWTGFTPCSVNACDMHVCTSIFSATCGDACRTYAMSMTSVRLSVYNIGELWSHSARHCGIFELHIRAISLVFWHQQRLAGGAPIRVKFALKVTHPVEKRRLRQIFWL